MSHEKLDPIVAALRARRQQLGISLRVVSEKSGYAQNTMWYWEVGRTMPALHKVHDWAEALGMKIELVEREDKKRG